MTKQKHTPGPWEASDFMVFELVTPKPGSEITRPYPHRLIATCGNGWVSSQFPEVEANARLIAAAPEMLEALKAAEQRAHPVSTESWLRIDRATFEVVRAAIAKAEGKE